ncbi:WXG100 family type VII secretion target [Streptomyces antimycoticus]|uniref:WXG100 family type VII secretion target n=1 Tax=Streptomyces antimycoticus TaxID=68175 RepID=UPI0036C65E1E
MGDSSKLPPLRMCYNVTSFEHASFEDMLAMVEGTDEQEIIRRGNALTKAQSEIEKIGDELKKRVGRVTWKGEGGDAFRNWGDDFANQALKLASFAGSVGTAMETAGQALSEVKKSMPERPAGSQVCYADQEKEKKRLEGLDKARDEALPQMYKLASYYRMSQETIAGSQENEPVFKPLPSQMIPDTSVGGGQESYGSPSVSAGTVHTAPASVGTTHPVADPSTVTPGSPAHFSPAHVSPGHVTAPSIPENPGHVTVPDATHTNIDTVKPSPPTTTAPQLPTHGGPPVTPVADGPGPVGLPVSPPPTVRPTSDMGRIGPTVGKVNPTVGTGGTKGPISTSRLPNGPTEQINGRPTNPVRADRSIVGGMQNHQAGTNQGTRQSRGTVIGREPAGPVGRVSQGAGPGLPAAGRPGGVIGAGPNRGASASTRAEGTARRTSELRTGGEFTPGGSGLVRGTAEGRAPGVPGAAASGRGEGQKRQRAEGREAPDQLTEGEETWNEGRRGTVPPVIG